LQGAGGITFAGGRLRRGRRFAAPPENYAIFAAAALANIVFGDILKRHAADIRGG